MTERPESIDELLVEALALEEQAVAMPAQIFSPARRFTDHPDREDAHEILAGILADSESAFVRRVTYTGLRYAGRFHATTTSLDDDVLKGLADPAGWVVYDAVWLAQDMAADSGRVREALRAVADGRQSHFDRDSESWVKARERARNVLLGQRPCRLIASSAVHPSSPLRGGAGGGNGAGWIAAVPSEPPPSLPLPARGRGSRQPFATEPIRRTPVSSARCAAAPPWRAPPCPSRRRRGSSRR